MWKPNLDYYSGTKYKRIVKALSDDITHGRLKPNQKLPPNRELADELGVSLGTVSKAFQEAKAKGLVTGHTGRGTYVQEYRMEQLIELLSPEFDKETIDLSLLIPPVFTNDVLKRSLIAAVQELFNSRDLQSLLGYQPHAGNQKHRQILAEWISPYVTSEAENVLICQSSQNALSMLLSHLTKPGDTIMSESLTDPGLLDAAQLHKLKLNGLKMDEQGILPSAFEKACRQGAGKILYCIPTFHNPTTAIMPLGRRKAIAEIARMYGITIIENGTLNPICREVYSAVSSFAPDISYYFTSFSKCLSPALRLGIIRTSLNRVKELNFTVRSQIWMASPIMAELVCYLLKRGNIEQIIEEYLRRAENHQRLAEEYLGRYKYLNNPTAYHMWLELPGQVSLAEFCKSLKDAGVTVASAEAFCADKSVVPSAVRIGLNAAINEEYLEMALKIISKIITNFRKN